MESDLIYKFNGEIFFKDIFVKSYFNTGLRFCYVKFGRLKNNIRDLLVPNY